MDQRHPLARQHRVAQLASNGLLGVRAPLLHHIGEARRKDVNRWVFPVDLVQVWLYLSF